MNINRGGWFFGPWLLSVNERIALWMCAAISIVLPVMTLAVGLLMVSRFRYAHVVNQYIRGKRPFSYLVKLVVVVLAALLEPFVAMAAAAMVYALGAPARAAWRRLWQTTSPAPRAEAAAPKGDKGPVNHSQSP
jgi:CDP-diacylglycerol--serine O-phosphatidyltransferase